MNRVFINNVMFRILWPPIFGALVYFLILLINNSLFVLKESVFTEEVYISIGLSYLVFEVNRIWIQLSNNFFDFPGWVVKILVLIGGNTILTIAIVTMALSAYFNYVLGFSTFSTELAYFNIIFLFTSWLYNLIYVSNIFLHLQNDERLDEESTLRESIEREFMVFQNDINPDLLYESLETLITLVHNEPVEAEDYIDRLSLAYRYILTNKQNELVNMEEDLHAAENLLNLLNVKHEENIKLQNHLSEYDPERQIIPGTIPGIIENIVKKSIINKSQPLRIEIEIEPDGYLTIKHHSNQRLLSNRFETGIMEKLQNAYSYFSDKPVVTVEAFGETYIKIPTLELSPQELAI